MTIASWICYASQGDPERYAATSRMSSALSGEATALFIRHAEETLPHIASSPLPLWQYVSTGDQGPAVLTRATTRIEADGAPAGVIWGLVLPPQHVTSGRLALEACVDLFPPDELNAPWPQALDLARLPAAQPASEAALQHAAAYAEHGVLRLPPPAEQPPVAMLCQMLELLPPGDRGPFSFATAPLGLRRVEIDPGTRSAPQSNAGALARLALWDRVKRVLDTVDAATSLRQQPQVWLGPLLRQPDNPQRVIALLRLLDSEALSGELGQTALTGLRRVLEQSLELASPGEVCRTLEELCGAGLFARQDLFPPLWPARVALRLQVLGSLSPQTLAQILRPDPAQLLQLLLTGLRRGPAAEKTVDLLAALARAPSHVNRQLFAAASLDTLGQLCADPQRLQDDGELATALVVLAMHDQGRRDASEA